MQKILIAFAATLLCLQVALIESKYADSSEEIQYGYRQPASLPGVGVIAQPILQAVTVQQPNYRNDIGISRLLAALAAKKDASSQSSEDDKKEDDDDEEEGSKEKGDTDERQSREDDRDNDDDDRDSADDDRDSEESDHSKAIKGARDNNKSPLCVLFNGGYGPVQASNPIRNWA